MVTEIQLGLLQVIGLSLPFIALYLSVLVEIHKVPKPISVNSLAPRFKKHDEPGIPWLIGDNKEWAGTVTLSYAYQEWDFIFAIVSIMAILASALVLIASVGLDEEILAIIGVIIFTLSYLFLILSVIFTLIYCYRYFSPPDETGDDDVD